MEYVLTYVNNTHVENFPRALTLWKLQNCLLNITSQLTAEGICVITINITKESE